MLFGHDALWGKTFGECNNVCVFVTMFALLRIVCLLCSSVCGCIASNQTCFLPCMMHVQRQHVACNNVWVRVTMLLFLFSYNFFWFLSISACGCITSNRTCSSNMMHGGWHRMLHVTMFEGLFAGKQKYFFYQPHDTWVTSFGECFRAMHRTWANNVPSMLVFNK